MLILARQENESIMVGPTMEIRVVGIGNETQRVRLRVFHKDDSGLSTELMTTELNPGQRVSITNDTDCTVVDVNPARGAVRLGIQAPLTLSIHRKEVWEFLQQKRDKSFW